MSFLESTKAKVLNENFIFNSDNIIHFINQLVINNEKFIIEFTDFVNINFSNKVKIKNISPEDKVFFTGKLMTIVYKNGKKVRISNTTLFLEKLLSVKNKLKLYIDTATLESFLKNNSTISASLIINSFKLTLDFLVEKIIYENKNIKEIFDFVSFNNRLYYVLNQENFLGVCSVIISEHLSEKIIKGFPTNTINYKLTPTKINLNTSRSFIYKTNISHNLDNIKSRLYFIKSFYPLKYSYEKNGNDLIEMLKALVPFFSESKKNVPYLRDFIYIILLGFREYTKNNKDKIYSYFNNLYYYGIIHHDYYYYVIDLVENEKEKLDYFDEYIKSLGIHENLKNVSTGFASEILTHYFGLLFLKKANLKSKLENNYVIFDKKIKEFQLIKLLTFNKNFSKLGENDYEILKKLYKNFELEIRDTLARDNINYNNIDFSKSFCFWVQSDLNSILKYIDKDYYVLGISVKASTKRTGAVFYFEPRGTTGKKSAADVVLCIKLKTPLPPETKTDIEKTKMLEKYKKYISINIKNSKNLFDKQITSRALFLKPLCNYKSISLNPDYTVNIIPRQNFIKSKKNPRFPMYSFVSNNFIFDKINFYTLIYTFFFYTYIGDFEYIKSFSQNVKKYNQIVLEYKDYSIIKYDTNEKLGEFIRGLTKSTDDIKIVWAIIVRFKNNSKSRKYNSFIILNKLEELKNFNNKITSISFNYDEILKKEIPEDEVIDQFLSENYTTITPYNIPNKINNALISFKYFILKNNKIYFQINERHIKAKDRFLMHSDEFSLTENIKRKFIKEGGNALKFAGATRLDASLLEKTFNNIKENILSVLPVDSSDIIPLGSTFKKCTDYGDIDILLDTYGVYAETNLVGDKLLEYIKSRLATVFPQVQKVNDFCILTLLSPVIGKESEYAQADILPTSLFPKIKTRERDISYMLFAFASPIEGTSKYKGAHRNILIQALCDFITVDNNPIEFNPNIGLIVHELERKYAIRDVNKIKKILFGEEYVNDNLDSFESIYKVIRKKYPNMLEKIMHRFFEIVSENKELLSYFESN